MAREILSQNNYYLVSCANSNLALDVAGGSKAEGANLRVYTKNDTYAQMVRPVWVSNKTTDKYYQTHRIVIPLSGRCVDTTNAKKASELVAGCNVKQSNYWAENKLHGTSKLSYDKKKQVHTHKIKQLSLDQQAQYGQLWYFENTGTFKYNNKNYKKYKIHPYMNPSLCIAANSRSSKANVTLRADSYGNNEWILVPVTATAGGLPAEGFYNIVSAYWKKYAVGVPSWSQNNNVQLKLHARNGSARNQQFFIDYERYGQYGVRSACTKDKYWSLYNKKIENNTKVVQVTKTSDKHQDWYIRPTGAKTKLDGKYYRVYQFWSFANVPYEYLDPAASAFNFAIDLDTYKYSNAVGDGLELWDWKHDNVHVNQGNKFILVPTSVTDTAMPVPSKLGLASYPNYAGSANLARRGSVLAKTDNPWQDRDVHRISTVVWPTWECEDGWPSGNNGYEWRYRVQCRYSDNDCWTAYGPMHSAFQWTSWRPAIISVKDKRVWISDGLTFDYILDNYFLNQTVYDAQYESDEVDPVDPAPSEDDISLLPDDTELPEEDSSDTEDDDESGEQIQSETDEEPEPETSETGDVIVLKRGIKEVMVEFQVRSTSIVNNQKVVSDYATKETYIHFWPQFTDFQAPVIEPDGVRLTFKTDYRPANGSNVLNLTYFGYGDGRKLVNGEYALDNLIPDDEGNCTALIPWTKMTRIPALGEQILVRYRTGTDTYKSISDGAIPDYKVLLPGVVQDPTVKSLNATYSYDDADMTLLVTFDKFDEFNVHKDAIDYQGDVSDIVNTYWYTPSALEVMVQVPYEDRKLNGTRVVELETEDKYTYRLTYPFGSDFQVMIVENGDLEQGMSVLRLTKREDKQPFHMWNFGNGIARVPYGTSKDGFVVSNVLTPTKTEVNLLGRKNSTITFGDVTQSTIQIVGVLYDEANDPYGSEEAMRGLLAAKYATYRSPRGHYMQVAVTGMTLERHIGYTAVQVSMTEVSQ